MDKLNIINDIKMLHNFDGEMNITEDYDDYDYLQFFNDCVHRYGLDVDTIYYAEDLYDDSEGDQPFIILDKHLTSLLLDIEN